VSGKGTDSYAKKLNDSYVAAQAAGWKFADLEIYVENGDMVGAFVTYVKD
jgi:predicted N-acyltransferase